MRRTCPPPAGRAAADRLYEAPEDPYCYPGTTVLKNLAGIRDPARLEAFELDMTSQRATEPLPAGRLSWRHYRMIHHHLFQDVYAWAGQLRRVRIAKDGSMFAYPEHIGREARRLFAELRDRRHLRNLSRQEFAHEAAHFLAELNAIHPFREGNGRTQLTFLMLLADHAGHPLDLERLDPGAMLAAMIASFREGAAPLTEVLEELLD